MNGSKPLNNLYMALWFLFLLAVPFYLMGKTPVPQPKNSLASGKVDLSEKVESGVPQVGNYIMAVLMILVFAQIGLRFLPSHLHVVLGWACFTCYLTLVNLAWSLLTLDLSISKNTLFYAYDFILFVTFLVLYSTFGDQFLRVTVDGVAASVLLQVALSPFSMDRSLFRQILFFNNPDQLGYYAVAAANLFYIGTKRFRIHGVYQTMVYAGAGYLIVLSLSKACLLALVMLLFMVVLDRPRVLVAGGLLFAALLVAGVCLPKEARPALFEKLEQRIETKEADESVEMRGYDRLVNHPEYLLFGAGEGAYDRFRSVLPSELHSSYGSLLFCYGFVGSLLFAYGLFTVCAPNLGSALYMLPVLFYGFIHHGLRFTLFWVLLAFLCCFTKGFSQTSSRPLLVRQPAFSSRRRVVTGSCHV